MKKVITSILVMFTAIIPLFAAQKARQECMANNEKCDLENALNEYEKAKKDAIKVHDNEYQWYRKVSGVPLHEFMEEMNNKNQIFVKKISNLFLLLQTYSKFLKINPIQKQRLYLFFIDMAGSGVPSSIFREILRTSDFNLDEQQLECNDFKLAPIHNAAFGGHLPYQVGFLSRKGIPLDHDRMTQYKANLLQNVELLLERKADVNCKILAFNKEKNEWVADASAIAIATESKNADILRLLIKHKADVNLFDYSQVNAASVAVTNESDECLKTLIMHGININQPTVENTNILHLASIIPNPNFLRMCLFAGATWKIRSLTNKSFVFSALTPLEAARKAHELGAKNDEALALLEQPQKTIRDIFDAPDAHEYIDVMKNRFRNRQTTAIAPITNMFHQLRAREIGLNRALHSRAASRRILESPDRPALDEVEFPDPKSNS